MMNNDARLFSAVVWSVGKRWAAINDYLANPVIRRLFLYSLVSLGMVVHTQKWGRCTRDPIIGASFPCISLRLGVSALIATCGVDHTLLVLLNH